MISFIGRWGDLMTPERRAEIIRQIAGVKCPKEMTGFEWALRVQSEHTDADVMTALAQRRREVSTP